MSTTTAYIALGANLGERRNTIERAIRMLNEHPGISVENQSRIIETEPMGEPNQPRYLNAAIGTRTSLSPRGLLDVCLRIEQHLGRDRSGAVRWGPRSIDLDLLLFGDRVIDEPGLTVPHPHLHERDFVLRPLSEIAGDVVHPLFNVTIRGLLPHHGCSASPRVPGTRQ